jgi:anti-sigma B factor antagonist
MDPRRTSVNHLLVASCAPTDSGLAVALGGELDTSNAADLLALLVGWVTASGPEVRCVAIDLAELRFVDSSGVQALVDLHRCVEGSGRAFELRAPTRAVTLVLETLGLVALLGVVITPGGGARGDVGPPTA